MTMRLTTLSLAAGLAACAVGPSTRTSAPPAPVARQVDSALGTTAQRSLDSLTRSIQLRADSAPSPLWKPKLLALDSASDLPWVEVLRDSSLATLVRQAVANNRDVRAAVARVREYRALLGVARGDLFPQISINAVASENQSVFGSFPPQNFNVVRLTGDLAWELDFWGRLRRQSQAAAFDLHGREEDERATVLTLVGDVATAYLELVELDEDVRISQETLASREASLRLARQRFEQGVISELDSRQFEAEVGSAAARLADFARQRAEKQTQLSVLVGQSPGPIVRGASIAASVQAVAVPDSIPGALLLQRPDVRRAERDLQAALARVGLALGNRLPKVSVTGQYGRQDQTVHDLFGKDKEIYTALVGVSIPIFTGLKLESQQTAARARADQARAHYEQTVLTALREASDALAGLRYTRDQLAGQETQTLALRRAAALAQRRYDNGVASYLEVLDAQRALFTAELALAQVERRYLVETVQLYKALGGSWR